MKISYSYLIGKTKAEVVADIGQEFNFYHAHLWTYTIKKHWLYKNTILYVYFDGEMVIHIIVRRSFRFIASFTRE